MKWAPLKLPVLFLFFLFITADGSAQTISTQTISTQTISTRQYIDTYKMLAETEMQRTGVPAAISLAQGIIETDSGNGWLVEHSNNHFGVKCKNTWTGKTILYDDDKKNECFRKYDNAEDSWKDHSNFLKDNARYAFLFRLDPLDYKDWAYGLKKAGYATSKTYAERLISTIEQYDLQQYSEDVLEQDTVPRKNSFSGMLNKVVKREEDEYHAAHPVKKVTPPPPPPVAAAYPEGVFRINDREVVYLAQNTSLVNIAAEHHLKLRKLLRYNDLENEEALPVNRLIYLQQKAKTGKEDFHIVKSGENMWEIAQQEGIRLKWLYKRNRMQRGQEPVAGEQLFLQGYAKHSPVPPTAGEVSNGSNAGGSSPDADAVKPSPSGKVLISKDTAAPKRQWPATSLENNSSQPETGASQANLTYHTVKKGETLYHLSKQFNVSLTQLREWNKLEGNDIKVGQKLIVGK